MRCCVIGIASNPGFPSPRQKVQRERKRKKKERGKPGRFARTRDVINVVNLMSVGYTRPQTRHVIICPLSIST